MPLLMELWSDGVMTAGEVVAILHYSTTPLASFLLIPFENHAVHHAADLQQFVFVMDHLLARESGNGVIFAQKNRLFWANFLAHAAENAADHVDIEFFRIFLDLGEAVVRWNFPRNDFDRAGRADEFAKLTSDAAHTTVRVPHERGCATIMFGQTAIPFFFRILHRHFRAAENRVLEMLDRDHHAGGDSRQIKPLAPTQFRTWNGDSHD